MIARPAVAARLAAGIGNRLDGSPIAVLLDIDGTLAPIAPRPEDADIPPATRSVLARLVRLPDVKLALVTGRAVADALRMAVDGAWIIGNHGLELRSPEGESTPAPEALAYEKAVGDAAARLSGVERDVPGSLLENKRWGLSVHYRLAGADAAPRLRDRVNEVARHTGLRITEGRKIFELRPPVSVNKGTASVAFLARVGADVESGSVLFAGDDRTDEDAFLALRAHRPRAVTARVFAAESVEDTSAEFVLDSTDEVRELLEWLAERRGARAPARR